MPIVCVNINGYYDPFLAMLQRAWDDKLTKLRPEQIMHFADSAEEAIQWVEEVQGSKLEDQVVKRKTKSKQEMLRTSSVMNVALNSFSSESSGSLLSLTNFLGFSCIFAIGFVAGSVFVRKGRI